MRRLKEALIKLDDIEKVGLTFGIVFILPIMILLIIDVVKNGASML